MDAVWNLLSDLVDVLFFDVTTLSYATDKAGNLRKKRSYMAKCHAFSRELLLVLWWCRQDGFRQFFRYGRDELLDIENVVCYGAAGAFRLLNLVTGLRGFIYAHGVIGYRVALIHWGRIPK